MFRYNAPTLRHTRPFGSEPFQRLPVRGKFHLATEGVWLKDGTQTILSTSADARNSTLTGSTLAGPNGSGQFLAVTLSTARTVSFCSTTFQNLSSGSTPTTVYGILQNKPRGGEAADVVMWGISKVVGGSTAIIGGNVLQTSSTSAGVLTPWVGGNGRAMAEAIESCGSVGAVFTARIYGVGVGST